MKKKFISFVLAAMMVLSLLPAGALATGDDAPAAPATSEMKVVPAPIADNLVSEGDEHTTLIPSGMLGKVDAKITSRDNATRTYNVTLTGTNIVKHYNAATPKAAGYWVGFGMPIDEGGTYTYTYTNNVTGNNGSLGSVPGRVYTDETDNNAKYNTVYFDVKDSGNFTVVQTKAAGEGTPAVVTTYNVTVNNTTAEVSLLTVSATTNGTLTINAGSETITSGADVVKKYVPAGTKLTITANPTNDTYKVDAVKVGTAKPLEKNKDGKYEYTMPAADITLSATFAQKALRLKVEPLAEDTGLTGGVRGDALAKNLAVTPKDGYKEGAADSTFTVKGTSVYTTNFTGYSSDTKLQNGNYVALKLTSAAGNVIKVYGPDDKTSKTVDADGKIVVRLDNYKSQGYKMKVEVYAPNPTAESKPLGTYTIDLSNVVRPGENDVSFMISEAASGLFDKGAGDLLANEPAAAITLSGSGSGNNITYKVSGTATYIKDAWTGFSSVPAEQYGNYLPLVIKLPSTVTVATDIKSVTVKGKNERVWTTAESVPGPAVKVGTPSEFFNEDESKATTLVMRLNDLVAKKFTIKIEYTDEAKTAGKRDTTYTIDCSDLKLELPAFSMSDSNITDASDISTSGNDKATLRAQIVNSITNAIKAVANGANDAPVGDNKPAVEGKSVDIPFDITTSSKNTTTGKITLDKKIVEALQTKAGSVAVSATVLTDVANVTLPSGAIDKLKYAGTSLDTVVEIKSKTTEKTSIADAVTNADQKAAVSEAKFIAQVTVAAKIGSGDATPFFAKDGETKLDKKSAIQISIKATADKEYYVLHIDGTTATRMDGTVSTTAENAYATFYTTHLSNFALVEKTEANTTKVLKLAKDTGITNKDPGTSTTPIGPGNPGGPGGPGGPGTSQNYTVTAAKAENGKVTASPASAKAGDTVTVTVTPDEGYVTDTVTVKDAKGGDVEVKAGTDGQYTFVMPDADVTVTAAFKEDVKPPVNPFTDVEEGAYYYDAVLWAVENEITKGTTDTTFSPENTCTRGQVVTFLWRAAGSPKAAGSNPFTDVKAGEYYYDAVLWAVEKGITKGTSDTTFSPDDTCKRGQVVTFLYRNAGKPAVTGSNRFTDVASGEYYYDAVLWAVEKEITKGTSDTTFSPDSTCKRGQIVTFLYRDLAE